MRAGILSRTFAYIRDFLHLRVTMANIKHLLPILIIVSGCAVLSNRRSPYTNLNGTWIPVEQVFAGSAFSPEYYAAQRLILFDSSYVVYAESTDAGKMVATDRTMDIYGLQGVNAGKHFKASYTLRNDTLKICYDLTGKQYPEVMISDSANFYFMSTFVRSQSE